MAVQSQDREIMPAKSVWMLECRGTLWVHTEPSPWVHERNRECTVHLLTAHYGQMENAGMKFWVSYRNHAAELSAAYDRGFKDGKAKGRLDERDKALQDYCFDTQKTMYATARADRAEAEVQRLKELIFTVSGDVVARLEKKPRIRNA